MFFFAVATTSELKQMALPVGSLRSAALATDKPSSRPIIWIGRYSEAYLPLLSCSIEYSAKQLCAYRLSLVMTTYVPMTRLCGTSLPSR